MLTADTLKKVFPLCPDPDAWATALAPALAKYEINTRDRICSFLAQTGHESGQFRNLVESLNYSAARLVKVWPKRFPTLDVATPYAQNEQKLGNFVYANRLGNGDVSSGDGFRYRGRGLIQLTGRSNYAAAGKAIGVDLVGNPEFLQQPTYAVLSAAWFWQSHGLNALADDKTDDDDLEDFREITRRINGGLVGVQERFALYKQIEALI
ncbi:MAG: glycoside hydrolase family 19 protein [Rhodocyclaceae bacterium]|nr:MAG: glycoside hydrolase family 19 protein [Rhodocyclaceae bacterium]